MKLPKREKNPKCIVCQGGQKSYLCSKCSDSLGGFWRKHSGEQTIRGAILWAVSRVLRITAKSMPAVKPAPGVPREVEPPDTVGYSHGYKPETECPKDRALVIIHNYNALPLASIGKGFDQFLEEYNYRDFDEYCETEPPHWDGAYIWEGSLQWTTPTAPDFDDAECSFVGKYRAATSDEWAHWCQGEWPWDPSDWYIAWE